MEKKCFFKLSTNTGIREIVMDLLTCLTWIKNDTDYPSGSEDGESRKYMLTPVWLTDEEFKNLPETEI